LCGGIFTILSAPIWVFCPENEFFKNQSPFRKKVWQEQEEADRRIESAISRIATRTVVEPSREPIVVAADIDYDKIIALVLKAMPKPETPEAIDYDKITRLVLEEIKKNSDTSGTVEIKITSEMDKLMAEKIRKQDEEREAWRRYEYANQHWWEVRPRRIY
jgi:hypothetical protein